MSSATDLQIPWLGGHNCEDEGDCSEPQTTGCKVCSSVEEDNLIAESVSKTSKQEEHVPYLEELAQHSNEESPRLSAASSSSNEKLSSSASICTDFYDSDRPISVLSTTSSGSFREGFDLYENIKGGTQEEEEQLSKSLVGHDMELVTSTAASLQATYREVQKGIHTPNNNAANRCSRLGSRSLSPFGTKVGVITHKLSYVERVVQEIIDTERMYVQHLRSIVEDYLGGIIDKQEFLPIKPEQVCALFGNIEDIYELNSELLQDLDSCRDDPVAVANCFVEKSQDFDIYTQYCTNYPNSVATLTECMRNKVLAKFFRDKQEMLNQSLPLGSYLLKPVQRILKYHLLLQEIAKHLDVKVDGYEVVEEAIETMTGVAWYINDMKRKHEHAVRQQEIQSLLLNWKGLDLTTYGELVLEGTFRVQRARSERTFFLFDKALFITKKRGDHFVYKTHIPCSSLMLIESTRDSLCFSLTHYKNSKQPHNVQAKTVEEKRLWTHHIKKLILENHHAIIPQKAKEAILEMDAVYPGRYKYSPERLKKTMSAVDPSVTYRSGRRQSEPSKHILKQLGEKGNAHSREPEDQEAQKGFKRQNSQSSGNAEKRRSVEVTAGNQEALVEMEKETSVPEDRYSSSEVELAGPLEAIGDNQSVEEERTALSDDPGPVENGETEHAEELKTFSSEEEEEEATDLESASILPPSVLDQASVIAERFINNISRRSSLVLDDGTVIGYITPRLTSRSSSLINLDSTDTIIYQNGSCDFQNSVPHQDAASNDNESIIEPSVNKVNSSSMENVFEERERPTCKRRESILSYQDRRLIEKIKTYYDNAEHEDAAFSIKRRESLTYIPTGVVRNSVFKINSLPRFDVTQGSLARQRISSSSSNASTLSSRPSSWADAPTFVNGTESEQLDTRNQQPFAPGKNDAKEHPIPITDDEFRAPNEMIKLWEEIEKENAWKEITDVKDEKVLEPTSSSSENKPLGTFENGVESHEPLLILEDSDLSTITEESPFRTPESTSPKQDGNPRHNMNINDQAFKTPIRLHPKIMQLANCMDEDMSEKMKNKVYQLARQYSQRIKCNKPVAHRRLKEIEDDIRRTSLPSVQEEKQEEKGKRKPVLLLPKYDHIVLQEHSPTTPTSGTHTEKSPKRLSFSPSCDNPGTGSPVRSDCRSPLSPVKTEKFHWPDVRELRSRYTHTSGSGKLLPVNRSQSVPDKMLEHNVEAQSDAQNKEFLSHSHSMNLNHSGSMNGHTKDTSPNNKVRSQIERTISMSSNINGGTVAIQNHKNSGQGGDECFYVSAEAPLENNKKVIVMEKLPVANDYIDSSSTDLESDDTFVHIRSPTTREKISLKAVIERCKAYQESEEYRSREESSKSEDPIEQSGNTSHQDSNQEEQIVQNSDLNKHKRVKSLRDRFQNLNSSSCKQTELQ
ncbi:pleckstrin homology domain-containing family G member 3 isoform 3-T3 [Rhinophrynus dorsalis]